MSIAIPPLEATCHSSEWLVEPHLQSRYKVKKCHATLQYNSEFHYLYGKANDDPRRSDIVCKDWMYEIEEGLTPYDFLGYDATKQVDVMPKHIIFHKVTWEFYKNECIKNSIFFCKKSC